MAAQRGLSLILYSRRAHPWQTEYFKQHQENTEGMTALIHPQNTYPDLRSGFDIAPGTSTRIALEMNTNTYLGEPYGQCSKGININSEQFISNFSVQTPYSCSIMCGVKYQYKKCKCLSAAELGLYPKDGMRKHTKSGTFCATMSERDPECLLSRINCEITTRLEQEAKDLCPRCIKPCVETWYFKEPSMTKWPSTNTIKSFIENFISPHAHSKIKPLYYSEYQYILNRTVSNDDGDLNFNVTPFLNDILNKGLHVKDFIDKNFYRLNIYFKDTDVYDSYEDPKQNLNSLWSSIGGIMGFWAGCSLITGLELIQLVGNIVGAICHVCTRLGVVQNIQPKLQSG